VGNPNIVRLKTNKKKDINLKANEALGSRM
jgi:hypothetical protein